MNVIKSIGTEIKELDTNFLLNLENYEEIFYNNLKPNSSSSDKSELARKDGTLENIDSKAFALKNKMLSLIDKMSGEMENMNDEMSATKRENKELKEQASELKKEAITSTGLYDGELTWYREQVNTTIVLLIGIVIGLILFKQMNLTKKDMSIVVVATIVLGYILKKIATFIVGMFQSSKNNLIGKL